MAATPARPAGTWDLHTTWRDARGALREALSYLAETHINRPERPCLDADTTLGDWIAAGLVPRRRIQVSKNPDPDVAPYHWHYSVEHDPPAPDALDYGSLESWQAAFDAACWALENERRCPSCNCTWVSDFPIEGELHCDGCHHSWPRTSPRPASGETT